MMNHLRTSAATNRHGSKGSARPDFTGAAAGAVSAAGAAGTEAGTAKGVFSGVEFKRWRPAVVIAFSEFRLVRIRTPHIAHAMRPQPPPE
jgi:hypothetical protein